MHVDLLTLDAGDTERPKDTHLDNGGNSHQITAMPTATLERRKKSQGITVIEHYDVAADAKKRISLRNAKTKYFHIKSLSNGCYLLEPRVLVPPQAVPTRTLKMLERSVAHLKKGMASAPIDLAPFLKD
jgi:hypothetical protein